MANLHSNKDNNIVSALDTALKLLMSLWNKITYFAGCFFIDNIMRNIVIWYDKRHSNATPNLAYKETEKINTLQAELETKLNECHRLQSKLDFCRKENEDLKQQISHLKQSLDERNQSYNKLRQDCSVLVSENETIKIESTELRKRCLPKSDVPSMIYFAQGDATGLWLRKVSASMSTEHIYKLTTKVGDTSFCYFAPIIQHSISDVIANRSITLIACDIISIAPSSSSIELVEEGVAVLENSRWKVTRKAKIKLI